MGSKDGRGRGSTVLGHDFMAGRIGWYRPDENLTSRALFPKKAASSGGYKVYYVNCWIEVSKRQGGSGWGVASMKS